VWIAEKGTVDSDQSASSASLIDPNFGARQTILAVNNFNMGNLSVGIGNSPTGNPDWTSSIGNGKSFSIKRLIVFVRLKDSPATLPPTAPVPPSAPPSDLGKCTLYQPTSYNLLRRLSGSLNWVFNVKVPVNVSGLGAFDPFGTGLNKDKLIAILNNKNVQVVGARVTNSSLPLSDNFRWFTFPPVLLSPIGSYHLISTSFNQDPAQDLSKVTWSPDCTLTSAKAYVNYVGVPYTGTDRFYSTAVSVDVP